MKKIIIIGLFLTSCKVHTTTIHYSTNINKCIKNLETLQEWVKIDYAHGRIPKDIAYNYMHVLQNTKCGLLKKVKGDEKKANCID